MKLNVTEKRVQVDVALQRSRQRRFNLRIGALFFVLFFLPRACFSLDSQQQQWPEKKAYLKMGLGASFSTKGDVQVPLSFWDQAVQGYNADFGTAPVFDLGFGYEIRPYITAELSLSYRPHYTYEKFQTPPSTPDTSSGFIGQKTRQFNFDVMALLFSLFFNGKGCPYLRWEVGPGESCLFPFVGGGVGVTELTLYNFRSVGLTPTGEIDMADSFASENAYTKRYRFAYQLMAGLEYYLVPNWAFMLGYRWFSTNTFRGPSFIRDRTGNSGDVRGLEWKQHLSANEVFFAIKYYF